MARLMKYLGFILMASFVVACKPILGELPSLSEEEGVVENPDQTPAPAVPAAEIELEQGHFLESIQNQKSSNYQPTLVLDFANSKGTEAIKIYIDSRCSLKVYEGTLSATGDINVQLNFFSDGRSDGLLSFYAQVGDSACGDLGLQYTLDTRPPVNLQSLEVSGLSLGGYTNQTSLTLQAGASLFEEGTELSVYFDSACATSAGQANIISGQANITGVTFAGAGVDDGLKFVYYKQKDVAGNQSPCVPSYYFFTLDTVAPANPTGTWQVYGSPVTLPTHKCMMNTYSTVAQGCSTSPRLVGSGSETTGTLEAFVDASCSVLKGSAEITGPSVTVSNFNFKKDGSDDGLMSFYIRQKDLAGNQSACVPAGTASYTLNTSDFVPTFDGPLTGTVEGPFVITGTFNRDSGMNMFDNPASNYLAVVNGTANMTVLKNNFWIFVKPTAAGEVRVSFTTDDLYDMFYNGNTSPAVFVRNYQPPNEIDFTKEVDLVSEKSGTYLLKVRAQNPVSHNVEVFYDILANSVATSSHHGLVSGSVMLNVGQSEATISIPIYDSTDAFNRRLLIGITSLTSSSPTSYKLGKNPSFALDIQDDETKLGWSHLATGGNSYNGGWICGAKADGTTSCFGIGINGVLANGSQTNSLVPSLVGGHVFKKLSAGGGLTCGINAVDDLYCWGANISSVIVPSGTTYYASPQAVDAGEKYLDISIGMDHVCGVTLANRVKCWGSDSSGKLGNGSGSTTSIPGFVDSPWNFSSVSASSYYSCGMTTSGITSCWGYSWSLELLVNGSSGYIQSPAGMPVDTLTKIEAGNGFFCGLKTGGELICWGMPHSYHFGYDTTSNWRISPTRFFDPLTFKDVKLSGDRACAITSDDKLYCWGGTYKAPHYKAEGLSIQKVVMSEAGSCAMTLDNKWVCWEPISMGPSSNKVSYLSKSYSLTPVAVETNVDKILNQRCYRKISGAEKCWGAPETHFNFTKGRNIATEKPVLLKNTAFNFDTSIYGCQINDTGNMECWGTALDGQVGIGLTSAYSKFNHPLLIDRGVIYTKVASSPNRFNCGVTNDGKMKCWGYNSNGQLGSGNYTVANTPLHVDTAVTYADVAVAQYTTCGLTVAGKIRCWGFNGSGAVGVNSTTTYFTSAQELTGTYKKVFAANSSYHICAIDDVDKLMCWGFNTSSQVKSGAGSSVRAPVDVMPGTTFKTATVGLTHTCAISMADQLYCWGENFDGQLGDGSQTNRTAPTLIDSGTSYKEVAAVQAGTCGITTGNVLKCWGRNWDGSLPTGINYNYLYVLDYQ
ncbi:RCC1 domain-containing protein [Bdellovibrio bacteriovorus]|uniref:RCC1 domain-containing protein n=1 Tax=Bdellovibrio TaxID=958 RepID=UPI0035A9025E